MGDICDCFLRVSLSMFARKSICTVSGDEGRVSTRMTSTSRAFLGGTEGGRAGSDMESGAPRSKPPPPPPLLPLLPLSSSSSRACWWWMGLSNDLWTSGGRQTLTEVIDRDRDRDRDRETSRLCGLVALLCRSFLFRFAVWGALCHALALVPPVARRETLLAVGAVGLFGRLSNGRGACRRFREEDKWGGRSRKLKLKPQRHQH